MNIIIFYFAGEIEEDDIPSAETNIDVMGLASVSPLGTGSEDLLDKLPCVSQLEVGKIKVLPCFSSSLIHCITIVSL